MDENIERRTSQAATIDQAPISPEATMHMNFGRSLCRAAALVVVAASLVASQSALAQAHCNTINKAIDDGLKELSVLENELPGKAGAQGVTNSKIEQTNWLLAIQMNLTLLQANGCRLPRLPVERDAYWKDAMDCEAAERPANGQPPAACVRANWKRSLTK